MLLIIVKIACGLNKMEMGYKVVYDSLKARQHCRARLPSLSKTIPPTAKGTGRPPPLTENIPPKSPSSTQKFPQSTVFYPVMQILLSVP